MQRLIGLDLLRTVAIVLMVIYHIAYDLSQFYGWDINVFDGGWKVLQIVTATLFIGLVGVVAAIPRTETPSHGVSTRSWKRACKRFVRIGSAAMLVTIATYIVDPDTFVLFGVLHMIAVSALVLPIIQYRGRDVRFARLYAYGAIMIDIFIIAIGPMIHRIHASSPLFIPLGATPPGFMTVDYFPMIPWFGIILIGYGIGHVAYHSLPHRRDVRIERLYGHGLHTATWPGRHSLFVYLLHQPIILGILWMILGQPQW